MQESTANEAPQPPTNPMPQAPATDQPIAPVTPYVENPGQTLGIVGIIANALGIGIAGIILGVMSRNKSREAAMSTTLGTVSLVWGIVSTVLAVLAFVLFMVFIMFAASTYQEPSSAPQGNQSSDSTQTPASSDQDLFSN